MARCEDIKLLLGPFEDGELEPHEMQEVARHLAACTDCEDEVADYGALAVSLRGAAALPDLTGFTSAVLAGIDESADPDPCPHSPLLHFVRGRHRRDYRDRLRRGCGRRDYGGDSDAVFQASSV